MSSSPGSNSSELNLSESDAEAEKILWAPTEDSGPKKWQPFKPEGENFSVLVPDGGVRRHKAVPVGDQMAELNIYAARDGQAVYALMWMTGPSFGEQDKPTITQTVQGFLYGFAEGYHAGITKNSRVNR